MTPTSGTLFSNVLHSTYYIINASLWNSKHPLHFFQPEHDWWPPSLFEFVSKENFILIKEKGQKDRGKTCYSFDL